MTFKDLLPPVITRLGARLRTSKYGWSGNFVGWADAEKFSGGYDSTEILTRVSNALHKVKSGQAVHERDSVLFEEIQYSWPALAAILWSAAKHDGRLRIMDFGGSLGSSYFQNRLFLSSLKEVVWAVVEQEQFVREGRKRFEDGSLRFYDNLETCVREVQPEVFLFSCVLQYLESPVDLLTRALTQKPELVVIDNMPFTDLPARLTVQTVPPEIYQASYPCWILNRTDFKGIFEENNYELVSGFESPLAILLDGQRLPYEGFIYQYRKGA